MESNDRFILLAMDLYILLEQLVAAHVLVILLFVVMRYIRRNRLFGDWYCCVSWNIWRVQYHSITLTLWVSPVIPAIL